MNEYTVLTNEINAEFDYNKIIDDYDFYSIDFTDRKDRKEIMQFHTDVKKHLSPKARFVLKGNGQQQCIVVFGHGSVLPKNSYDIRKMGLPEIKSLPKYGLLKIMLSLMMEKSAYFELLGNPYDIYYIHTLRSSSVTALKLQISQSARRLFFNLGAVNFMKATASQQDLYVEENGILVPYTKGLHKNRTVYRKGNRSNRKTGIPFLSFSGRDYTSCKAYFFHRIFSDIREYLSTYMSFSFEERPVHIYAGGESKTKEIKQFENLLQNYIASFGRLHIVNCLEDNSCARTLSETLRTVFGRTFPVTCSDSPDLSVPNLSVTMPKEYYEESGQKDPYPELKKAGVPVQNVTSDTTMSPTVANVLVKELSLKCEIHGSNPMLNHESSLMHYRYFAVIDRKESIFHKAFLGSSGSIETSPPDEAEQRMLEAVMFSIPVGEEPEYIIMDHMDNIMSVTKTKRYPLPDFTALTHLYEESRRPHFFSEREILSAAQDTGVSEADSLSALHSSLSGLLTERGIPSDRLMALPEKVVPRKLKNRLEEAAGRPLRFLPRNRNNKTYYRGMLGISYFTDGNDVFYHTGPADANLNAKIDKNSPYRRVYSVKGSVDMQAILPFMEYYFVKHNELTVLPYPLKYAREGYLAFRTKISENENRSYKKGESNVGCG